MVGNDSLMGTRFGMCERMRPAGWIGMCQLVQRQFGNASMDSCMKICAKGCANVDIHIFTCTHAARFRVSVGFYPREGRYAVVETTVNRK